MSAPHPAACAGPGAGAAGDAKRAREHYTAALRVYREHFPDHFAEGSLRVVAIRQALAELAAPKSAAAAAAAATATAPPKASVSAGGAVLRDRRKNFGIEEAAMAKNPADPEPPPAPAPPPPRGIASGILDRLLKRSAARARIAPETSLAPPPPPSPAPSPARRTPF
eukprot:tig00000430_g621.t1